MQPFKQLFTLVIKVSLIGVVSAGVVLTLFLLFIKHQDKPYPFPENLVAKPASENGGYDIVKVGNSHSQAGISFKGFQQLNSLDLSSVAQKYDFDLALLQQHQHQIKPGAVILIPVTPLSFTQTNEVLSRGFDRGYYGRVSPLFIPNLNAGDYIQKEFFPFLDLGQSYRESYALELEDVLSQQKNAQFNANLQTETATSSNQEVATESAAPSKLSAEKVATSEKKTEPTQQETITTSRDGGNQITLPSEEAADPLFYEPRLLSQLAAQDPVTSVNFVDNTHFVFTKWTDPAQFNQDYIDKNVQDLKKLINFSLKKGWQPVLVSIPISAELQRSLPEGYLEENMHQIVREHDWRVPYLDLSNQPTIANKQTLFADSDHLNQTGAFLYSYVLHKELINAGLLDQTSWDYHSYSPDEEER